MAAFDILRAYFEARSAFTAAEIDVVRATFILRMLGAGDFLQRAGEISQCAAFVTTGCLRSYVIDPKGKEHIVQFAPETWWIGDSKSHATQTPSPYFIQAVEASELMLIDGPSHQKLIDNIPGYASGFRTGLQRHLAAKDVRIVNALSASAEERYLEFVKTYPSIVQRVPQWMLASYFGVSPETVSRIRKNLSRK